MPLDGLYKIIASCTHTEGSNYVAILLEVIDENIKKINNDNGFVLQVWKLGGQMVFEKSLKNPVCNWNITEDKFIF